MTHAVVHAACRLIDLLERENAALRALDLPGANALLGKKRDAAAALAVACADAPGALPPPELARHLRSLAEENRALLERALAVQGQVVELIAGAVRRAAAPPHYAPGGAPVRETRAIPFTLSARA